MALARWKKHREQAIDPEVFAEALSNPSLGKGDPIGALEWRDFRSGKGSPQGMQWPETAPSIPGK